MSKRWKKHNGGECPVEKGTMVDVVFRDGDKVFNVPAGVFLDGFCAEDWSHSYHPGDIMKWRLAGEKA